MRRDKNEAIELRKKGLSYTQIEKKLGVPRSTLSGWLAPKKWSENIKKNLIEKSRRVSTVRIKRLNKIRGTHLRKAYTKAREEARGEFEKLKYHPLFISALVAYWGEGEKSSRSAIKLANVDPLMIRLFKIFLMEICHIPEKKLKMGLFIYKDLDDQKCKDYWAEQVGLPRQNFIKSMILPSRNKTRPRCPWGVCTITTSSSYLKEKMMLWLKLLSRELQSEEYYKMRD